ncbi:carboxypeptidase M32 [Photobacterium swingsii]|uniref:carboxypeptidase M32 n=1 Tax=Photobacterium swingsii TaxID=680026 RepID=UPI004067FC9D
MSNYQQLEKHFKKLARFNHLGAMCGWDQASMMPEGGNDARSAAMAELAVYTHQLLTDPKLEALFTQAESEQLSADALASLREMKNRWQQATVLPEDLVEAQSKAGSVCEHAWRGQRKDNNWADFQVNLEKVVDLSRQEAQIRAEATGLSRYNALVDLYEPGMTTEKLDTIFADVKSWLPDLIQQIQKKQESESVLTPQGPFAIDKQKELSLEMMKLLGFDFNHGRLDVSVHPFCGGVPTDVRMTTRYDEADFTSALMGVIHETGHARYEQGLPKEWAELPAGEARSMGIHESQSLLFEMQLSRSPEFIMLLAPTAQSLFNRGDDPAFTADNITLFNTRVKPAFIRVDADEVTYPAHIILRYEIERDLIEGKIEVADIPSLWNQKMTEYLGVNTEANYTDGCMQDIHWTDGSFGYFPSYTLGAMYAAQFMAAMRKEMDIEQLISDNNLTPIFHWLKTNIWSKASTLSTDELVIQATGEALNPRYFKEHLEARYLR